MNHGWQSESIDGLKDRWTVELSISDEHVSCTALATRNASLQILFKYPTPAIVFWKCKTLRFAHFWEDTESLAPATQNDIWTSKSAPKTRQFFTLLIWNCASRHNGVHFFDISTVLFLTFWLRNVLGATTPCSFWTCHLPKVLQGWCVLYVFTSKCASRHNSVHFFDISTSKSAPKLRWFVHFDFEMCFGPQRRAIFRHVNFQKWSECGVLCTFWFGNVFRATTVCNYSSLIWPDGSAPAALASLLLDPPEPQTIGN